VGHSGDQRPILAIRETRAVTWRSSALVTPNLAGELVCLRAWQPGEGAALQPACGDEDICRFTTVPRVYSALDAEAWIARQEQRRIAGEAIVLAINPRGTARPVGMVGLFGLDTPDPCAQVGYWLVRDWRGRGLARDAVGLLASWAFRDLPLRVLHIDIEPANSESQRLAAALGAQSIARVHRDLLGEEVALTRFILTDPASPPP
jgi:RimJ/RimL family protein N-acetyltransferase